MFPIFTTAWALAILFHLSTPQGGDRSPASVLLFVAAIAAVFWPAFSLSLLALPILQIVQFWGRLPRAQTSEYFKFICGLCLLSTYAELSLAQGALLVEPEAWLRSALPLLRFAVSLLFFASVLHKLNVDFLQAGVSVAPEFFDRFLASLGLPKPRWIQHSSSYITILIESFIAVGLLFPVTRLLAVTVLLLFFFTIGLQGVVQFSSLMYASALLFFDDKVLDSAVSHLGSLASPAHVAFGVGCLLFFSAVFVFRRGLMLLVPAACLWSAFVVFALARLVMTWGSAALWPAPMFPLSMGQIALLILFSLNELGPHVGYKDWPSFRMYSNLKTGISGNHLFLRGIFVPFFKSRAEVMITAATRDRLYGTPAEQSEVFYVPYSSLAAMARHQRRHPSPGTGDKLRQIDYVRQSTCVSEGIESFGRQERSWLDFVLPSRFFYHFPAPHRAGRPMQ
jgi:uncharacterized membrane protein YphA (DoxX/SURF4 family)